MKIVAYYRVSTKRQGASGLGLEAQKATVAAYAQNHGAEIVAEYTEVESGRKNSRVQLAKAMASVRRSGATLVIAKLDRLSRNVAFTATLMESGIEFVACDNEHATRFTIHVLAAAAEQEACAASIRTREALAAYKARGGVLGKPENMKQEGRLLGAQNAGIASAEKARKAYADLVPDMVAWRNAGATLAAIADRLNGDGQTTQRGLPWSPTAVHRVLGRAA